MPKMEAEWIESKAMSSNTTRTCGIAKAVGPVEITLSKPSCGPGHRAKSNAERGVDCDPRKNDSLSSAAHTAASGEIHVKTSGLNFDRNTGQASTVEKVEFRLGRRARQRGGCELTMRINGLLVLDRAVQLDVQRRVRSGEYVWRSMRSLCETEQMCSNCICLVHYSADVSSAERAKVYFRDDGSARPAPGRWRIRSATATGGRLAAPTGRLDFDEHSQPRHAHSARRRDD